MKAKLLFIACLLVSGCGSDDNASFVDEYADETCTIIDNVMMCPDGTEYELPEDIRIDIDIVQVDVEPTTEDDPEALCESNNRNGRKCKKIKKEKK